MVNTFILGLCCCITIWITYMQHQEPLRLHLGGLFGHISDVITLIITFPVSQYFLYVLQQPSQFWLSDLQDQNLLMYIWCTLLEWVTSILLADFQARLPIQSRLKDMIMQAFHCQPYWIRYCWGTIGAHITEILTVIGIPTIVCKSTYHYYWQSRYSLHIYSFTSKGLKAFQIQIHHSTCYLSNECCMPIMFHRIWLAIYFI
jgi:hypothetical protein